MKPLLVNTYDRGGAANACLRLHAGLLSDGIDSHVLLKNKQKNIPNAQVAEPIKKRISKFQKAKQKFIKFLIQLKIINDKSSTEIIFIENRSPNLELFSYPSSNYEITENDLYKDADIINLHWVASFLDYKTFFRKNSKPVVWTLHDMNPFTGGEHYEEKYLGIDKDGLPLKRLITDCEKAIFKRNIKIKLNALKECKSLHIVTLCEWMAKEVRNSEVLGLFPVHIIPNGINPNIFKPRDRTYSRELLNIPLEKKIILFVADSIHKNRKGFEFLSKAIKQLERDDIILCAIGYNDSNLKSFDNIIELGEITDERIMSNAYSAVDVFVIPSLMDNLPNTVLESIMCGTPVIGFPVGGISEMIQDGENGLLTKDISVSSLLDTIVKFLNTSEKFDRNVIRENAKKKYDQKIQSRNYINLFDSIMKNIM
jgi:glycosyltransferase involved in cell wall biosynthesis